MIRSRRVGAGQWMLRRDSLALAGVVAVLGFLVVTATVAGRQDRQELSPRKAELIALIHDRRSLVDDLDEAVASLRRDVGRAQEGISLDDLRGREAAERSERLAVQAGTVPLEGPGLVVKLSPSTRKPGTPEEAGAYRIHDTDLQLTVNALAAAGAEALAVNGSRLVATTPIRAAGSTIVVNFRPLSPPYVVEAIGADRHRFESSEVARRFKRWTTLFGLGFEVSDRRRVEVPAYTGRVNISAAEPAPPAPPPPASPRLGR